MDAAKIFEGLEVSQANLWPMATDTNREKRENSRSSVSRKILSPKSHWK